MQKGSKGSLLSASEKDFVEGGLEQNVRSDGRERLACRPVEIQVRTPPGGNRRHRRVAGAGTVEACDRSPAA